MTCCLLGETTPETCQKRNPTEMSAQKSIESNEVVQEQIKATTQAERRNCGDCADDISIKGKNDCNLLNHTAEDTYLKEWTCTGEKPWNFGACGNKLPRDCCAMTCCLLGETTPETCKKGNSAETSTETSTEMSAQKSTKKSTESNEGIQDQQQDNDWENYRIKIGLFWTKEVQLVLILNKSAAEEEEEVKVCSCINRCPPKIEGKKCMEHKNLSPDCDHVTYGKEEDDNKALMAGQKYNAAYIRVKTLPPRGSYEASTMYWSVIKGYHLRLEPGSPGSKEDAKSVDFKAFIKIDEKVVTSTQKSVNWQNPVKASSLFKFTVKEDGQVSLD